MKIRFYDSADRFSLDGRYRYWLMFDWRSMASLSKPPLLSIGLNPSTARAWTVDPTIHREVTLAQAWGFGRLEKVNLFALCATDPRRLQASDKGDPIGPENRHWIERRADIVIDRGGSVLCAWGNDGSYMHQALTVIGWLENVITTADLKCIKQNKTGHPVHTLYQPNSAALVAFDPNRFKVKR